MLRSLQSKNIRAQTLNRPNIVFILTDDQKLTSMPYMPYLSSKPHGSWIEFTNAFVNVPLCCPSRATILTGLYSHHTGVNGNNGAAFKDDSTLSTWLSSAGYKTALVGKYLNQYPFANKPTNYIPPGWTHWVSFAVDPPKYYSYPLNENGTIVSYGTTAEDYSTDVLKNKAVEFINDQSSSQPFFLYFAPFAPHTPHSVAPRHKDVYKNVVVPKRPNFNEADVSDKPAWVKSLPLLTASGEASQLEQERKAYEQLLAVDEAVKAIIDKLIEKGMLENTIIIYMSDNGFSQGAHRWEVKRCEFEECIRVPLLIRYPGIESRTELRLVTNIDIAPTITDMTQVTIPYTPDGVSLMPLIHNTASSWRSSILMQSASGGKNIKYWGVRTESWKYIELTTTGEKELYDLVNDPYELVNVANQPEYASIQESLAAELVRLKGDTTPTPRPTATPRPTTAPTLTPVPTPTPVPTLPPDPTPTPTPQPPGSAVTFTPTEDAYVRSASPNNNYGSDVTLRTYKSSSSATSSHLRFSVMGLSGPVQSAKLRFYVTDATSNAGDVFVTTDNGWTESSLTWSNQPSTTGSSLGSFGAISVGTWEEIDVTLAITGNGTYTFGLVGATADAAFFSSKEGSNPPELVVVQ